jgi:LPXTG-site transpeptidase (sortase) family protein
MTVSIPAIDVQSIILHPETPRVDVLDEALRQGAVYYPGSGTIEEGNIFLFGHSSNWAIVQNQAYKTFNGLEDLTAGEEIFLTANGKTYVYEVESVSHVDANVGFVDLSRPGRRLTISTCDTFGAKSDRWVVDAVFKEVRG